MIGDPLACQSNKEIHEWFFQTNLEAAAWYLKIRLCLITGRGARGGGGHVSIAV